MLYVLIPLALGLLGIAVWALLWAIKSGQFDDLESHGWSVVLDDDQKPMPEVADESDESDESEGGQRDDGRFSQDQVNQSQAPNDQTGKSGTGTDKSGTGTAPDKKLPEA